MVIGYWLMEVQFGLYLIGRERSVTKKKKLVDEVFVISGVIKVIPWLFRISQKPNLIIVLLYIASKKKRETHCRKDELI